MTETIHIAKAQGAPPCTVVIFGASGDLAKRKLIPALYNLRACGQEVAPHDFAVLGFARRPIAQDEFRETARAAAARFSRLELDPKCWSEFAAGMDYLAGLDEPDGFHRLKERLEQIEAARSLPPNRIYYLSVPPEAVTQCVERLDSAGLIAKPGAANFSRVVVEKPIGRDLESALEIEGMLRRHLDESQIFRIDHYLGKETVQNLFVLRFANAIFERMWGARNVDHVQIFFYLLHFFFLLAALLHLAAPAALPPQSPRAKASGRARCTTTQPARCATWCRITCCNCSR